MKDFVQLIAGWIEFLWPFEKVKPYQRGLYVVAGRWQKEVGPGIYPIIPWFIEVVQESMAWADLTVAYNTVDAYMETTRERLTTIVATRIAEVDAARLAPEKRSRLLTDLTRWVDKDTRTFGVETLEVTFTTFVTNARPYRLLGDNPEVVSW
jgi:hypothetical protein